MNLCSRCGVNYLLIIDLAYSVMIIYKSRDLCKWGAGFIPYQPFVVVLEKRFL
ncbi:hypothetical protein PO909_002876 [Leuciscus waleckii]